jgi:hypothetical protein
MWVADEYDEGDDIVAKLTIPDDVYELLQILRGVEITHDVGIVITGIDGKMTNLRDEPMSEQDWYLGEYVSLA